MLLFSKPENIKDRMNFGGRELSALESPSGVSIAAGSAFWAPRDWYEPRSHWDWLTVVDDKGIGQRFEIPKILTDAVARMVALYGPCDGPYAMEIIDGEAFAKAALYDVEYVPADIGPDDEDYDEGDQAEGDDDANEDDNKGASIDNEDGEQDIDGDSKDGAETSDEAEGGADEPSADDGEGDSDEPDTSEFKADTDDAGEVEADDEEPVVKRRGRPRKAK